jgi:hypothetical protein
MLATDWTRHAVIKAGASAAALAATATNSVMSAALRLDAGRDDGSSNKPYFRERGYYITFMRSPLFTFETWKDILDGLKHVSRRSHATMLPYQPALECVAPSHYPRRPPALASLGE